MGTKKLRGFAALTPERRKEIARLGGKASQSAGTGHRWTPETAKVAGQKGGAVTSADRDHMARIGHIGGRAKKSRRAAE